MSMPSLPTFFRVLYSPSGPAKALGAPEVTTSFLMVLFILGIWLTPQDLVQRRYENVEEPVSERLVENVHMQGFRNPEEGGVHRSTPQ
jgi:hypothetical protein